MKILINALSGIGDALMFSPALSVLKKHLPDAQTEMMVMFKAVRDIYLNNPNISKIHFIDFLNQPRWKSLRHVINLRKNRYDASLNVYPSNRKEYNIINFLIGARLKIAHRYNNLSAREFDFLNNRLVKETKDLHNVIENFNLICQLAPHAKSDELGRLEIYIPLEDEIWATKYCINNKLTDKLIIGFHAGSATFKGHINKRWGIEKYTALAEKLNKDFDAKIVLFGNEAELNNKILGEIRNFAFYPETDSINKSLALIEKCRLFVSGDTAFMHIAAALGIPQVAIFGYTNYRELYPWKNKHILIKKELECSPCFYNSPRPVKCIYKGNDEFKCMRDISVEEVYNACIQLIGEIPDNLKS